MAMPGQQDSDGGDDRERLVLRIGTSMHSIETLCERWGASELAVFGSAVRDDFGRESDIDILVRFRSENTPGLFGIVRMEWELADILGRRVDLVHRTAVEMSRNYIRRKAILGSARVIYPA